MQSLTQENTQTRESIKLAVVVMATVLITCSQGLNAVIFPVSMENYGFSKTLIGLITAAEVLAGIFIGLNLPKLISQFGLFRCFLVATLFRVVAIILLGQTQHQLSWLLMIFIHGLGAFTFLMLIQILISSIPFKKNRAFKIALFGTAISVGYAIGPLLFQVLSWQFSEGELYAAGFYLSAMISFLAAAPLFFWGIHESIDTQLSKPNILKLLKESPDIMGAIIIVGIAILGLSQFITLYGTENGWSVEVAAILLSAYMFGALFLEAPLSWVSDYIGRWRMLLFTSLACFLLSTLLPFLIDSIWLARADLFLLGGFVGALYSVALTSLSERYHGQRLVEASSGFALLDNVGGVVGLLLLGLAMDFSNQGLPLVLGSTLLLYLICLLYSRKTVGA